jgi:2-iminobutanoate/2-iminopropanoate deaminase
METIDTKNAPKAIGPYSQAVRAGDFLFVSGQLGIIPETGELAGEKVEDQAEQLMKNLASVLGAAGAGFENVADVTIFLKNMDDFSAVNGIYGRFFDTHKPARATVEVARLPKNAKIEIRLTAFLGR